MTTEWIIAVDLGGTQLRAARCALDGTLHTRTRKKTRAKRGPEIVIERICRSIEQMWPDEGLVRAIGVSAPGPLDPYEGVVLGAPNLPGWDCVPLRARLEARFEIPVILGNDANLAALGEQQFGAGRGFDDLVYMTISTGIGGGIVLGGRLLLGRRGLAGEIGHMVLLPDGPQCGCGNRGCLEALASGTAIGRQARTLVSSGRAPSILDAAGGDIEQVSAASVGKAAAQGDVTAISLLEQAGRYIGIAVANLMHLLNPPCFVIGGGVAQAGDLLLEPIRRTARESVQIPQYAENVEIVPAALGDDTGLMGAFVLARSEVVSR